MSGAPESDDPIAALRDTVLAAALPHIPFDGWSRTALANGARDAGLAAVAAERAFPGGGLDAIEHHNRQADRRMAAAMAALDTAGMKVREKVTTATRLRLEQNAAHREAVRRGLSLLALPHNAPTAARLLYRTVDAIWRAAGDTATDWNFYSKRALLAGVYSSTLLYWLADESEGQQDSWDFLDRRIADVMRVPRATGPIGGGLNHLTRRFQRARTRGHVGPKAGML